MNVGLILAGGAGKRAGGSNVPKQFLDIYGKPIVVHTAEIFDLSPSIHAIAVVCHEAWLQEMTYWIKKYEINKVKWVIAGGRTRQESVFNGLNELRRSCEDDDIIVIHDAARPLVSLKILGENVEMARKCGAVDTVVASADTIIRSSDNITICDVPQRSSLYIGQTPQSFKYSVIRSAHEEALKAGVLDSTDDCQLVLKEGKSIYLVKGEKLNFKITTMEDVLMLKAILKLGRPGDEINVIKEL